MGTSDATSSHLSGCQINGVSFYAFSPLSEPPDVRNWFSSYEYESPSQSSSFIGLDIDSFADDDVCDASFPKSTTETSAEKNLVVEARKKECIPVAEENGFVHDRENFSPDNNTSDDIVKEKFTGRTPSLHSGKDGVSQNQFEGKRILNGYDRELPKENESEKTVRTLERNEGPSECGSCVGCYHEPEKTAICAFGLTEDRQNSKGSNERWISTKSLRDCPGNERRSRKQNSAIKQEIVELVQKECTLLRKREALVDQTNVLGKWHCPSKSKPNLGPPMKQLRLEHWVNRATKNNPRF